MGRQMLSFDKLPLGPKERDLIQIASSLILKRGEYGRHHVACALLTTADTCFSGLHISSNYGAGSICAEAVAIAESQRLGPNTLNRIVSVRHTFDSQQGIEIVPPCGSCRQIILEYGPHAQVILDVGLEPVLVPIEQLLPIPFCRRRAI